MKRQTKNQKKSTSKGQFALVAVLGVILVGVIASNFRSASDPVQAVVSPDGNDQPTSAPQLVGQPAPSINPSPFGVFAEDQNWSKPGLDELVKFDPMSDGSKPEEALAPHYDAEEINELRNAQDAIVFTTDGQTVARIGSKEFHVGDVVGGLEIRNISSAGIVLGEPN